MPDYNWHENKKNHDLKTSKFLANGNIFLDWEIVTLFYSTLHNIDYYFSKQHGIDPNNHDDRKKLVSSFLRPIERDFRILYHLSRDARYNQVLIKNNHLQKAVSKYNTINAGLTEVICKKCGHSNLALKYKCEICKNKL